MVRIVYILSLSLSFWVSTASGSELDVFPPALPGWSTGDVKTVESRGELLGLTVVRQQLFRDYFAPGGGGLAIMIDTYDCEGEAIIQALHTDADFRSQAKDRKGMHPLDVRGREAMEIRDEAGGRLMVSVALTDCVVVSLGGPQPPPSGAFEGYLEQLDFERIKRFSDEH